jgi:hypothetical protein
MRPAVRAGLWAGLLAGLAPGLVATLAAAMTLIVAPQALAATPYVDGISDQNLTDWNGALWYRGPPASPFASFLDATLIGSSPTPLRFARYVVAYDLACDPGGGAYQAFRSWLGDVREIGLSPVVAFWYGNFDGNRCPRLPAIPSSVAEYNSPIAGVAAFMRAFPGIGTFEAWNEPNDGPGPDLPPASAADFWLAATADACADRCATVIAGDFSDAQPNLASYERSYAAALGRADPPNWGIHPDEAVNDEETTTLSDFYAGLPNQAADRVWYTEVAAYYCTPTRNTMDGYSAAQLQQTQEQRAHFLVATLMQYPFTPVHVFYYEFMYRQGRATPCAVDDSALFAPGPGSGGPAFVPRSASQDVLPNVSPQSFASSAPAGRLVYYPTFTGQIWADPWHATSF